MQLPRSIRVALIGAAVFLCIAAPALAQKKVALVIGNAAYKEGPLKNPANDARAMAAKLRRIGFQVIERLNATKTQMETSIADFGEALNAGAVGLFYYAGHGLQVNGRNFLVPVDAAITSEQRVRLQSVDVDVILEQMEGAKSGVNLVILDACRNNPFERRFRAAGGGLAQINAPQGTLIAYATAPGRVASDGEGANGLYTAKLLRHMEAPGVTVEEMFKRVRVEVSRETNNEQTPWESSSLTGSFFFTEPAAAAAPQAADKDLVFWQSVKDSDEPAMLEAYLGQFPSGTFAALARAKLAVIGQKRPVAQDQPKPSQPAAAPAPAPPPATAVAPMPAPAPPAAPAQVAAVAVPPPDMRRPAATDGVDGTWRGSIACGTSAKSRYGGSDSFTTYEFVLTVKDGKLSAKSADGEMKGTIGADGAVSMSGSRTVSTSGGTTTLSFQGKEENGRINAKGRWFDRECTLAYVKNK